MRITLTLVAIFFSCAAALNAQWKPLPFIRPDSTQCFAVSGTTLYAGTTYRGVFRSTDLGVTWKSSMTGLTENPVSSILILDSTVFAVSSAIGTFRGGIYRSRDKGETWVNLRQGLNGVSVYTLFAADTVLFAGTSKCLYRSSDKGESWSECGLDSMYVSSLLLNGSTVFAIAKNTLHRSTDYGRSWSELKGALLTDKFVQSIHNNGSAIIAILSTKTADNILRSTDNGNTWVQCGIDKLFVNSIVTLDSVFLATSSTGIFRSADYGKSWTFPAKNTMGTVQSLVASGSSFTAFGSFSTFFSADTGKSWTPTLGLSNVIPSASAVIGSHVYVSSTSFDNSALYRSSDRGKSWSALNVSSTVFALTSVGTTLFAASSENLGRDCSVHRSSDEGNTWIPTGLIRTTIYTLNAHGSTLFAGTNKGVLRSTDNGDTWVVANNGLQDSIILAFASKGTMAFVASMNKGIFRTSNNGDTWEAVNNGMPAGTFTALMATATDVFAGNQFGKIYRTMNNGNSWMPTGDNLPNGRSIVTLGLNGKTILASTTRAFGIGGVYRSTTDGEQWAEVSIGLKDKGVRSFAVRNSVIYAATYGDGMYLSNENGMNWTEINDGLESLNMTVLMATDSFLLAGTGDAYMYKMPIPKIVVETSVAQESDSRTLQCYPNPSSTVLLVDRPSAFAVGAGRTLYTVVDVLGQELLSVISDDKTVVLTTSSLPAGSYCLRAQSGSYQHSALFSVVR